MTGTQYRKLIARYLVSAFGSRGIEVYEEVNVGTSIIGKQRRLDLLVLEPASGKVLGVECKFQDSLGTVDEKIPYALDDLRVQRLPGVISYAGAGFSPGVQHLLQASEFAAYCWPEAERLVPIHRKPGDVLNTGTWQLDHMLALTFGWWDLILSGKRPVTLSEEDLPTHPNGSATAAAPAQLSMITDEAPARAAGDDIEGGS